MILGLRRLRMTAAEIAETLRCRSRRSRSSCAATASASSAGSGSSRLSATSAPGRASSSTSTSRSSDGSKAAPANAGTGCARTTTANTPTRRGRRHNTVGWECVHVAVDDYSRLAYAEVLTDETASTAVGFLKRAVTYYQRHGITVERILTDNGSPYRSMIHAVACRKLGIRHLRSRPYRPQTNGKAERFIRTMLNGWAYGADLPLKPRTHTSP